MKEEEKQKFRKLAAMSKEKNVPEGYVYVGFGLNENLPFGRCLSMYLGNCWSQNFDYRGNFIDAEYACPIDVWNKIVGQGGLPEKWYIAVFNDNISIGIQQVLFSGGFQWNNGQVPRTGQKCIGASEKWLSYGSEREFISAGFERVKIDELLNYVAAPTEKKLDLKILSHDVILGEKVSIGCQKFTYEEIDNLSKIVEGARLDAYSAFSCTKFSPELFDYCKKIIPANIECGNYSFIYCKSNGNWGTANELSINEISEGEFINFMRQAKKTKDSRSISLNGTACIVKSYGIETSWGMVSFGEFAALTKEIENYKENK